MPKSNREITIALDCMGGDNAPSSVIAGASKALEREGNLRFLLVGDEDKIIKEVNKSPNLVNHYHIIHTTDIVSSNDTPAYAIRNGKRSSMYLAVQAVKNGEAHAVVSAGNTGALMAISKIVLRTLSGIDRPAICGIVPTLRGKAAMLDMGANIECSATNLMQFAIMGSAFAKIIFQVERPKVGLLNVGSEDIKGSDTIKLASQMIREFRDYINFYGYIEGDGIIDGFVDVIVTDGFSGNIALKTAEGTAKLCREFMKEGFQNSIIAKIGYLLAKASLKKTFSRLDHRNYNGAMLLGLDGIVVKSHGSSDELGNANAILVAKSLASEEINKSVANILEQSFSVEALIE
ncbi:MAG: phosphate acyltransferase PlsX [Sphingobacteriia bacterium]|nr:phosphate acyltransferase PlsX [Sphingobacteriia bacterium]